MGTAPYKVASYGLLNSAKCKNDTLLYIAIAIARIACFSAFYINT